MADDVVTPLNPPVAPVEKEELEKTLLDVNVFQPSCNKRTVPKSGAHSS
jgi:hypothetical protein